jgi:hypothetical protein
VPVMIYTDDMVRRAVEDATRGARVTAAVA